MQPTGGRQLDSPVIRKQTFAAGLALRLPQSIDLRLHTVCFDGFVADYKRPVF